MFGYEFTKREKILMLCLALLVIGLLWYRFIFVATAGQIDRLDSQISIAQTDLDIAKAKVEQMESMRDDVDKFKADGTAKVTLPDFDNTTHLMASLNSVLDKTSNYTLDFDDVDTTPSTVLRGVTISFGCSSMKAARSIMNQLERETYACSIDSVTMLANSTPSSRAASSVPSSATGVSVSLHAVFYETNKDAKD